MDRRASLLTSTIVAVALAAGGLAAVTSTASAAGEVALLTWEGYADESFVKDFEAESGCKLTATYVGSNDDFAPKLAAGGGVYDLISPSIDTTSVMVKAGLVEPYRSGQGWSVWTRSSRSSGTRPASIWTASSGACPSPGVRFPFMYRTDKITEEPTSIAGPLGTPNMRVKSRSGTTNPQSMWRRASTAT